MNPVKFDDSPGPGRWGVGGGGGWGVGGGGGGGGGRIGNGINSGGGRIANGSRNAGDVAAKIINAGSSLLTTNESIDQGKKVRGGTILK